MRSPTLIFCQWLLIGCVVAAGAARAHPLAEGAADVVIAPDRVTVDARVTPEEVSVAANRSPGNAPDEAAIRSHCQYLLKHLRVEADGRLLTGTATGTSPVGSTPTYHLEYPLTTPPAALRLSQDLLIDRDPWSASLVLRIRQSNQDSFQTALLPRGQTAEFGCEWPAATSQPVAPRTATRTDAPFSRTFRAYFVHGVMHILTGYDHLLFVSALVLAATSLWNLVKVVTAFTLAHTLTLTLCVFNVVRLSEHVVEPMISASIVFVALQNVFWPRGSRGTVRLVAAFGFGLFHGLGFAGGLMDAMSSLPGAAVWAALVAFSLGVEVGHQCVVLPLFGVLRVARGGGTRATPTTWYRACVRTGSGVIALGGVYFLLRSFR